MTIFLLFLGAAFFAGYALPERLTFRLPLFLLSLIVAGALMTHRFA